MLFVCGKWGQVFGDVGGIAASRVGARLLSPIWTGVTPSQIADLTAKARAQASMQSAFRNADATFARATGQEELLDDFWAEDEMLDGWLQNTLESSQQEAMDNFAMNTMEKFIADNSALEAAMAADASEIVGLSGPISEMAGSP